MFDLILPSYHFALKYAYKLVADLPDDRWCGQPVAGVTMNHAAWTLGHLAWASDNMLGRLNLTPTLDDAWRALFMFGTRPLPDRSAYPAKDVLLGHLDATHARLLDAVTSASLEVLNAPPPNERMRAMFPTTAQMVAGLMTSHFSAHNGQLSAWRRAMGFPSAF